MSGEKREDGTANIATERGRELRVTAILGRKGGGRRREEGKKGERGRGREKGRWGEGRKWPRRERGEQSHGGVTLKERESGGRGEREQ